MSNSNQCPRCDNKLQASWKYCRSCGLRVEQSVQEEVETSTAQETVEEEIEVQQFDKFDKVLYYKVLSTRAERAVILKKKMEIRKEIDALLEQLQAGLIGKETALPKVKELKDQVKTINETYSNFSEMPEELPVEILNDEITSARRRLKKIDKLKSDENVGKDTIKEAKRRAEESLKLLRDQQSQIFGHLRSWNADLDNNIDETRKEIELLYVRYKTEEITESSYKEQKEKLVQSLENDTEVVKILSQILDN